MSSMVASSRHTADTYLRCPYLKNRSGRCVTYHPRSFVPRILGDWGLCPRSEGISCPNGEKYIVTRDIVPDRQGGGAFPWGASKGNCSSIVSEEQSTYLAVIILIPPPAGIASPLYGREASHPNSMRLFDLQKSTWLIFRLAPGILNNEEALDVKMDLRVGLFVPLFSPKTNNLGGCFGYRMGAAYHPRFVGTLSLAEHSPWGAFACPPYVVPRSLWDFGGLRTSSPFLGDVAPASFLRNVSRDDQK